MLSYINELYIMKVLLVISLIIRLTLKSVRIMANVKKIDLKQT
jgi:hypothetical protein